MRLKRIDLILTLIATALICLLAWSVARAAQPDVRAVTSPTPEITPQQRRTEAVVCVMQAHDTPVAPPPTPPVTPTPTPMPALPAYAYDEAAMRCLSRAIWSVTPKRPTHNTKLAFCELVQNRVDDESEAYKDDVRAVLLQRGEFLDYDPNAYRSEENDEIAAHAMTTWTHATRTGDRSYRLVPPEGVMCSFYQTGSWSYIRIFDRGGNVVYDSGRKE